MGNPLGPTLANVFLCYYEQIWLDNCPSEFKPVYYKRYIDDSFILFKSSDHIPLFLNYLNSQHNSINFTSEVENNSKLNFLDVCVTKSSTGFNTSIHRKKTFTGLGLRFDSFVPSRYKINLIKCLVTRAFRICSNLCDFDIEIEFLKKYFSINKYPYRIIVTNIQKAISSIYNPKPIYLTAAKKPIYVRLPYLGIHSKIL